MIYLDCEHDTDSQMNMLMPMLMMGDSDDSSDNLMMLMMMQTMGNSPVGMDMMMPFLMMNDNSDDNSLMMMVMMNAMTGGMNSQGGFDTNFNMLLPLAMKECDDGDDECEKNKKDMMIILMAMQSKSPNSGFGSDMLIPMMMMDDDSNNEDLIFFMMMNGNKQSCDVHVEPEPVEPEEPTETIFRTWRVNADGTKTLIAESDEEQ